MADFDPPFGNAGDKRLPTVDERSNGFPCGPADLRLFNALFHRIESEIGEVIDFAGLTPTDSNYTQLRQAIEALINAATGGGDTNQFLLVTQARGRLPIFPEIQTANWKMGVISPATGSVRVPGNVTFLHRGIFPITTVQTDFATDASKIYHLRWDPTNGFRLRDLASVGYNPTTLAEANVAFDSSYDDMLVARVVTNSSNVPTITNLINKDRYSKVFAKTTQELGTSWDGLPRLGAEVELSRTPRLSLQNASTEATLYSESLVNISMTSTRYTLYGHALGYVVGPIQPPDGNGYISGSMAVEVSI